MKSVKYIKDVVNDGCIIEQDSYSGNIYLMVTPKRHMWPCAIYW